MIMSAKSYLHLKDSIVILLVISSIYVNMTSKKAGSFVMTENYYKPEMLADTDWLLENLDKPNIRIVDCDPPDSFFRAHIPNSVNVGSNTFVKSASSSLHVMDANEIEEFMSNLGIDSDTTVICYDGRNSLTATRFWWVLNYYGHTNSKVLNGGWVKWISENKPVSISPNKVDKTKFVAKKDDSLIADHNRVLAAINSDTDVIWDARTIEEYNGQNSRGNKNTGHVPSCVYTEWLDLIDSNNMSCFKSPSDLDKIFESIGVTREKQVFTY